MIPTVNWTAADMVLGQPDLTSGGSNNGGIGAQSLADPYSAYGDGTRLYVADTGNNRVLIWNTVPTANRAAANVVVGQADMTSNGSGGDAQGLNFEGAVFADGTRLYVADTGNSRVLIWTTVPTANGVAANAVLGQPDMTTTGVSTISSQTSNSPLSLYSDGTRVFVGDTYFNRVNVFAIPPTPLTSAPTFSVAAGTYGCTQSVSLFSATAGGSIHYTTNGSSPTCASTTYSSPISISSSETVKAITCATDFPNSIVSSATYTIMGYTACGASGNGCYDNSTATSAGHACLSDGEQIDYVYANGSSGFQVWQQHNSPNSILHASGLWASSADWQQSLNGSGKGFSGTSFTVISSLAGRACPSPVSSGLPSVYINDSNKVATGYCLYYDGGDASEPLNSAGTSQTVSGQIGMNNWSNYNGGAAVWYVGNIQTCASEGMRLPTIFETQTTTTSSPYYPTDASPTFAQSNGVPSYIANTWTASANTATPTVIGFGRGQQAVGLVTSTAPTSGACFLDGGGISDSRGSGVSLPL